jgi:hypothetical protein
LRHHLPQDDQAAIEDEITLRDDQQHVIDALRELPHRQRDCIVLRYYDDLGIDDIAATLGISRNSVKTHLGRALRTLEGDLASDSTRTSTRPRSSVTVVENRLRDALFGRVRRGGEPRPLSRIQLSIEDDRRRRQQRRAAESRSASSALGSIVYATTERRQGEWLMDWWVLELLADAVLIALALWLGPLIKRFGKSYAADVFRANPRTGKSFIVLTDIAYYLIFLSYIMFTMRYAPAANWGDTVTAAQLQHETARIAGILLIIGLLHGLNLLAPPVMGRLLTLNRQLDVRRRVILLAAAVVIIVVVIVGPLDLTLFRSPGVGSLLAIGGGDYWSWRWCGPRARRKRRGWRRRRARGGESRIDRDPIDHDHDDRRRRGLPTTATQGRHSTGEVAVHANPRRLRSVSWSSSARRAAGRRRTDWVPGPAGPIESRAASAARYGSPSRVPRISRRRSPLSSAVCTSPRSRISSGRSGSTTGCRSAPRSPRSPTPTTSYSSSSTRSPR